MENADDSHTGSGPSFEIVRAWLAECQENHHHCKTTQPSNTPLPNRVIDVGPADESVDPYLLETHGKTIGKYVTLSHCWGSSSGYVKTIRDNVASHKSQIKLHLLPQTFKDAIKVVRELGIRYLWIDSLCIVQDDVQEWEREAALMGWYYTNALLTISAAHGMNSEAGLFNPRDYLSTRPCELEICTAGTWQQRYAYARDTSFQISKSSLSSAYRALPVDNRAWILQEQLLSPRSLTYSTSGISWRCQTMRFDERAPLAMGIKDFISDRPQGFATRRGDPRDVESTTAETQRNWMFPRQVNSSVAESEQKRRHEEDCFIKDWARVVHDYTSRGMTRQSDKLVAIRGVADVFAAVRSVKYTAGIWNNSERCFVQGLLWSSSRPGERLLDVAPSWSWASVQCEVGWLALYCVDLVPSVEILKIESSDTVARCEGTITLRGNVRRGVVGEDEKVRIAKWPRAADGDVKNDDKTSLAIGLTPHWKYVIVSMDERVQANSIIYFVELATGRISSNRKVHALALLQCESPEGTFRRVGFSTWDQVFWKELLPTLVTISTSGNDASHGQKDDVDLELRTMDVKII
jgi:hypothetical protein